MLGSPVPLETERGYHVNVPWREGVTLNRPVVVAGKHYVMVPMRDGVRVTSGEEMGGLKAAAQFHADTPCPRGCALNPDRTGWRDRSGVDGISALDPGFEAGDPAVRRIFHEFFMRSGTATWV